MRRKEMIRHAAHVEVVKIRGLCIKYSMRYAARSKSRQRGVGRDTAECVETTRSRERGVERESRCNMKE